MKTHGRPGIKRLVSMAVATALGVAGRKRKSGAQPRKRKAKKIKTDAPLKVAKDVSYTKTKTKKKSKLLEISQHNDLSVRNLGTFWPGKKWFPKYKTIGKSYYHDVSNWVATSLQGEQCVDSIENILTRDMIVGLTTSARNNRQRIAVDLYYLAVTSASGVNSEFPDAATVPSCNQYTLSQASAITGFEVAMIMVASISLNSCLNWSTVFFAFSLSPLKI